MKQIPLLQGKALLVELPEGAVDRFLTLKKDGLICRIPQQGVDALDKFEGINLPPGNWRIIGMLSEVTEEQASNIVQSFKFKGGYLYNNYITGNRDTTDTAIESLESAIESGGYRFTNPNGDLPSKTDMGAALSWEQAQSRVLSRERCILLGREI